MGGLVAAGGGFVLAAAAPTAVGPVVLPAVALLAAPLLGFYKRASP